MAAPQKPWERVGVNNQSASSVFHSNMSSSPLIGPGGAAGLAVPSAGSVPAAALPAPPPRPSNSISRPLYGNYGNYGSGGFGGYSGLYGSGFGSMHSPYGGMGYGSYGYNRYGMQDVPGSSFARVAEENSRPAFQSIESIVHAVSSVAMMLDSSFQAVYSSFRAVIGVADNFSRLKTQMVQIFSALALIRTLRYLIRRFLEFLRLRPAGQAEREWREALAQAAGSVSSGGDGQPKKSAWPILMFFGIILGGPWLIWKLISSLSNASEEESWMRGESDHVVAQALYGYSGQGEEELSFSAGQQIILAPKEMQPNVRGWLLGSVGSRRGLVPYNYIKVLGKRRGLRELPLSTPLATQNLTVQNFDTDFSQSALNMENRNSSGTHASSQDLVSRDVSMPDLDSVFSSAQQASLTSEGDGPHLSRTNQYKEAKSAADIIDEACE